MSGPGYWMNEASGVLRPAVEAYLNAEPLSDEQIACLRAYLRQWIDKGAWRGPQIAALRASIDTLISRERIEQWLDDAVEQGIDPL